MLGPGSGHGASHTRCCSSVRGQGESSVGNPHEDESWGFAVSAHGTRTGTGAPGTRSPRFRPGAAPGGVGAAPPGGRQRWGARLGIGARASDRARPARCQRLRTAPRQPAGALPAQEGRRCGRPPALGPRRCSPSPYLEAAGQRRAPAAQQQQQQRSAAPAGAGHGSRHLSPPPARAPPRLPEGRRRPVRKFRRSGALPGPIPALRSGTVLRARRGWGSHGAVSGPGSAERSRRGSGRRSGPGRGHTSAPWLCHEPVLENTGHTPRLWLGWLLWVIPAAVSLSLPKIP